MTQLISKTCIGDKLGKIIGKFLIILILLLSPWAFAQEISDVSWNPIMTGLLSNSEYIRPVGDIEGEGAHFAKLVEEGVLEYDSSNQEFVLADPSASILFNGDYMRRGTYGRRATDAIFQLLVRNASKENILVALGNHDGNILSWFVTDAKISANAEPNYFNSLSEKNLPDSQFQRLLYWADAMGITNKIENDWLEQVLIKKHGIGITDFHTSEIEALYYSGEGKERKLDYDKLDSVIPTDEFAKEFIEYISPGGTAFELLKLLKLRGQKTYQNEGVIVDFSHSGMSTADNFGVVPGAGMKYLGEANYENYLRFLKELERSFKMDSLTEIERLVKDLKETVKYETELEAIGSNGLNRVVIEARIKEIASLLENIELIRNVDLQYSNYIADLSPHLAGYYATDSQVYPYNEAFDESTMPAIPSPEILEKLAKIGINITVGGHKPIGDVATLMVGYDEVSGKITLHLFHDTSYSTVEGNNSVRIYSNGSVRVLGTTKDGLLVAMEHPGQNLMEKWNNTIKDYKEEIERANANWETPNAPQEMVELYTSLDRYSRIGKVVGGRLVIGFSTKTKSNGEIEVDYDTYITVRKDGYNFIYQEIDIWGMFEYESNNGPLEYATSDLTEMMERAENEKRSGLLELGEQRVSEGGNSIYVHTEESFLEALEGKNVIDLAGASAAIKQVKSDPQGKENLDNSLEAFRNYLASLSEDEEYVFTTGGTAPGYEAELTALIAQANTSRAKPFRVIGVAALVFGLGETDPHISEFFLMPGVFYWNDFKPSLIQKYLARSNAKSISFRLGGGGGIIGNQIKEAIEFAKLNPEVRIFLELGITAEPDDVEFKKRGAVDKFYDQILAGVNTDDLNYVSIVKADSQGNYTHIAGQNYNMNPTLGMHGVTRPTSQPLRCESNFLN